MSRSAMHSLAGERLDWHLADNAVSTARAFPRSTRARATPQPATAKTEPSLLTELIVSGNDAQRQQILLPIFAHLSRQTDDQWLTFVASDANCEQMINTCQLKAAGAAHEKIRVIRAKSPEDVLWITWEALSLGNSHTVIACPGKFNTQSRDQLEHAARSGRCKALIIREAQTKEI